jgi:hypothetical protein
MLKYLTLLYKSLSFLAEHAEKRAAAELASKQIIG